MAAIDFAAPGITTFTTVYDPETREKADCALGPDRQIRILSVSPDEDDHTALLKIVDELPFLVTTTRTCCEAAACLNAEQFAIILCERDLPDGNWLQILDGLSGRAERCFLIVTSRLADASLWAEVLNLGGYDLIAKPFNRQEVQHVLTSAWVQSANPVQRTCAAGAA